MFLEYPKVECYVKEFERARMGSSQQAVDGLRPCLSSRSSIAILWILGATVVGRSRHRNERRT